MAVMLPNLEHFDKKRLCSSSSKRCGRWQLRVSTRLVFTRHRVVSWSLRNRACRRALGSISRLDFPTMSLTLLQLVYDDLRKLAAHKLATEPPGHTLQPTALVHEAWLRLSRATDQSWQNRTHTFRTAAECGAS